MSWNRRQLLKAGGALAGVSAAGLLAVPGRCEERRGDNERGGRGAGTKTQHVTLHNLHTAERLEVVYLHEGTYVPEALSAIEVLLRDFRTGERHVIDPRLMDYLVEVARMAGAAPVFSVISGYRSAQTNAGLREKSKEVAQHSLHMEGRAIDVRMASVDCARLASHAQDLQCGGVGYYHGSDFVHLDTGRFRTWKG